MVVDDSLVRRILFVIFYGRMRRLYVGLLVLVVILVVYNQPANSMETTTDNVSAAVNLAYSDQKVADVEVRAEMEVKPEEVVLPEALYTWIETVEGNGDVTVEPDDAYAFTLEFTGSQVVVETDCNHGVSSYEAGQEGKFIFGLPALTKRACVDSQEQEYLSMLSDVRSYEISEEGILRFELKDGSVMRFE